MEGKQPETRSTSSSSGHDDVPSNQEETASVEQSQEGVGAKSAHYFALAEQALISGSNFLLYLYAARMLPKDQWGALSFALAFLQVLQGFQRAFVTVPMITSGDKHGTFANSLRFWRQMQGWVTAVTLFLLLCIYIIARPMDPWVGESILLTAVLLIPWYYMEFARRVIIMSHSMNRLLGMAICYALVLLLTGAIAHSLQFDLNLFSFVLAMALAAVISSFSARVRLWPTLGIGEINAGGSWSIRSLWRFGRWAAASSLAYSGYTFAIQAILAAIAGPAALGVYTAARNLTQPVATLVQAIDSVDKPRAGRAYASRGMSGLWQVIRRSWGWLLILALPYVMFVGFLSEPLLILAYGEKYADASVPVQMWCVVMLITILVQPLETGLYVVRRPDWLFYGRAASAGFILILTPWLVTHWSVNGALVALAAGWGLAGAIAARSLIKIPNHITL